MKNVAFWPANVLEKRCVSMPGLVPFLLSRAPNFCTISTLFCRMYRRFCLKCTSVSSEFHTSICVDLLRISTICLGFFVEIMCFLFEFHTEKGLEIATLVCHKLHFFNLVCRSKLFDNSGYAYILMVAAPAHIRRYWLRACGGWGGGEAAFFRFKGKLIRMSLHREASS